MSIVAEDNSDSGPSRYSSAGQAERRQIQADVVQRYRHLVFRLVRRLVASSEHWQDVEQEGVIGLLIALEKYVEPKDFWKPTPAYPTHFWFFAQNLVRNEIQRWMDVAVHWRPRRMRKEVDRKMAAMHRKPASLDAVINQTEGGEDVTLYQLLALACDDPETLACEAQLQKRLLAFVETLTQEERNLLLRETRNRFCSTSSRRYLNLVERARAFVRGQDGEVDDVSRSGKTG